MSNEKKGITVKVDPDLHAEIKQYIESQGMTMAEFIEKAAYNELHPKFNNNMEENNMEVQHKIVMSQVMLPHQANVAGNVHGGEIMKFMDMAAAAVAMKFSKGNCVTARVDELLFHLPIFVGALVTCTASLVYVGRTSMEVLVRVESEDLESHSGPEKALSANFTMVCMGKNGRPQAIGRKYVPETELEKKLWKEAEERREIIKQRKAEKKAAPTCK